MPSTVQRIQKLGLINPPSYIPGSIAYEAIVGSVSYGVSDDTSDMDVNGFYIPPKYIVFPHTAGVINGFGSKKKEEEEHKKDPWQQHHVVNKDEKRKYDFTMYGIVRCFQLCMENNPNMVDLLFVPPRCILHITRVGEMVRENRHIFLHAGSFQKFKGYAHSQLHKAKDKEHEGLNELIEFEGDKLIPHTLQLSEVQSEFEKRGTIQVLSHLNDIDIEAYKNLYQRTVEGSKRAEQVKIIGFDVKFLYHVVRLALECEQILIEGTLDLERNREQLKTIRRGERSIEDVEIWYKEKELELERMYHNAIETKRLPYGPDEKRIKELLLNCLEEHYGSLSSAEIIREDESIRALRSIKQIIDGVKGLQ
ncbi:MAG: nucleotidyltransferase domain-containing protein [Candidatus Paceibacterota bacterium]|jgi:predicted nucleotidyltransferase